MSVYEKRMICWIKKYYIEIVFLCLGLLGVGVRFIGRDAESGDYTQFLYPWYCDLKENGFHPGVGNYTTPYILLIWMVTKFERLNYLYVLKIVSCFFDYLLIFFSYCLLKELTPNRNKHILFVSVLSVWPTMLFNSAYWGQCDSIYSSFVILFLLLFLKEKYGYAFFFLAIAGSLKLQSVFLLPFVLLMYIKQEKFSLLNLLWIPFNLIVTAVPVVLKGGGILYNFKIYMGQTGEKKLYNNAIGLWSLFFQKKGNVWIPLSIVLTISIFAFVLILLLETSLELDKINMMELAAMTSWTALLFLPHMHERYGYCLNVIFLIIAFARVEFVKVLRSFLFEICTLLTYGAYWEVVVTKVNSWSNHLPTLRIMSIFSLVAWAYFLYDFFDNKNSIDEKR